MPVRSIVDIDVNDKQFQKFMELFDRYQDALAKTPSAWKKVDQATAEQAQAMAPATAALLAHKEIMGEVNEAEKNRLGNTKRTADLWTGMAKSSTTFATNVLKAGASLLKWGSLVFGGMAAGSFWGMDRLAGAASGTRRSAMGYGMSTGELQAFRTNFSRLTDPDSFLARISEMETHPEKSAPFYTLGLGRPTGNTENDAVRALQALWSRAQGTPLNLLGTQFGAMGWDLPDEDLRRFKGTGASEFQGLIAGNRKDIAKLGYSDSTGRQWEDFNTQLERAKEQIKATFITGLVPLTGPLGELSGAFAHLTGTVLGSPVVKQGIKDLTGELNKLSKWVNSSDFDQTVKNLFSADGPIAKMYNSFKEFGKGLEDELPDIIQTLHAIAHPWDTTGSWAADKLGGLRDWLSPSASSVTDSPEATRRYLSRLDSRSGLPDNLLESIWSGKNYPGKWANGTIGAMQLPPEIAARYGADPWNPEQSFNASGRYMADLSKKYGGDVRKMLAAKDWGESNLDADIARYRGDWLSHAPADTQRYVSSRVNSAGGLRIQIENNTGGNAVVSIGQLSGTP